MSAIAWDLYPKDVFRWVSFGTTSTPSSATTKRQHWQAHGLSAFNDVFVWDSNGVAGGVVARAATTTPAGPSRRIHPRWIREELEDELPEAIRKKTKLTKKVEALLAKQSPKTDVVLDIFQTKAELQAAFAKAEAQLAADRLAKQIADEDDWLLLMI